MKVTFWFEFASTYSYLSVMRLPEVAAERGVEVIWRPFLLGPIFAAQGFVHTLLDGAIEDKKVRHKFLKKAAKSLDGLNILVQNLLTISQIEIGEITMHYESFDIINMSREVIDQLEGKAEKKNITISHT